MTIKLLNPVTSEFDSVEVSEAMEAHFNQPANATTIILEQINGGMYQRWFKGKTGLTCIDFGANVGLVSRYMMPACDLLVSVEPTPSHFDLLDSFIRPNDSTSLLNKMCIALAECEKEVVFCTGHATENKITTHDGGGNGKISAQAQPLSYFIDNAGFIDKNKKIIDFVKVDIEGYENKALSQEQIDYAAGKVKVFFVELHPGEGLGFAEIATELTAKFTKAGYEVEMMDYQTLIATWK